MKIVFWSPIHGQAGTTSNLLVTALISGILLKQNCLLMQTHFNHNNLEAPLIGCNSYSTANSEFFRDVGLDALIRNFKASRLNKDILENCCISLLDNRISLLPGTSKSNRESFENEMDILAIKLLRETEEYYDYVFLDVCSGKHPLSLKLIEESDLTIINLSQNMEIVSSFFTTYPELALKKVFYLIGNYDRNSKYNIHNIRRSYFKYITRKNSAVIPYNTAFMDAQCDGKVIEFIRKYLDCGKKNTNYYFISKSIAASEKLLKVASLEKGHQNGAYKYGRFIKQ